MSDDEILELWSPAFAGARRPILGRNKILAFARSVSEAERARAEAAEKDAARYRYIRDNHEVRGRAMEIVYGMNGEDWDAAIDAALTEQEPKA